MVEEKKPEGIETWSYFLSNAYRDLGNPAPSLPCKPGRLQRRLPVPAGSFSNAGSPAFFPGTAGSPWAPTGGGGACPGSGWTRPAPPACCCGDLEEEEEELLVLFLLIKKVLLLYL